MTRLRVLAAVGHALAAGLVAFPLATVSARDASQQQPATPTGQPSDAASAWSPSARRFYLDPLVREHRYRAGKNSFIIQNLKAGERRTLADLRGSGSVRHIWTTWARSFADNRMTERGLVWLRVFVDGEETPSVSGPIDELFEAAARIASRYVPQPAFNFESSFNLYLPLFFSRAIRIEIEAREPLDEYYAQVDYRATGRPERRARLVSGRTPDGLSLRYEGDAPSWPGNAHATGPAALIGQVELRPGAAAEIRMDGPAIIREIAFDGDGLDDLEIAAWWDGETKASVRAPLAYFFGDFRTVALDAQGSVRTCYFPMPFGRSARFELRNTGGSSRRVSVRAAVEHGALPVDVRYFHAWYREETETVGYRDVAVLLARGGGHFVGLNLFDSGHNHGGGDTALIDADSPTAQVLHGICGEDYFSFAWHHTGAMHALAGAPVHERRFRHHLENPYPFASSIAVTFGTFAGLHPKSVAFWYQAARSAPRSRWTAVDTSWQVLGPVGGDAVLPARVDTPVLETDVAIAKPERLAVGWTPADMRDGFLDLTHHYRHFTMARSGTGFVAGRVRFEALTNIYAARGATIDFLVGHDDGVEVRLDGRRAAGLAARSGFGADTVQLHLASGWHQLMLILDNDENTNWRWAGASMAFDRNAGFRAGLRFTPDAAGFTFQERPALAAASERKGSR